MKDVKNRHQRSATLTHLVKNLVLVWQLNILLEEVALSVQLLCLPPVIEGACDEDFVGFWVLPGGAR